MLRERGRRRKGCRECLPASNMRAGEGRYHFAYFQSHRCTKRFVAVLWHVPEWGGRIPHPDWYYWGRWHWQKVTYLSYLSAIDSLSSMRRLPPIKCWRGVRRPLQLCSSAVFRWGAWCFLRKRSFARNHKWSLAPSSFCAACCKVCCFPDLHWWLCRHLWCFGWGW